MSSASDFNSSDKASNDSMIQILIESLDIWFLLDENGVISQISPRIETEFGYKVADVAGKRIEELFNNASDMILMNRQVTQNGFVQDFVSYVKDSRNHIRTVSFSIKAILDAGTVGWIRDITVRAEQERNERESYLNFVDVFNSNLDGLLVVEADTFKIIDANITVLQMLHFSHNEMINTNLLDLCDRTKSQLEKLIAIMKEEGDHRFELSLCTKNQRTIDVEVSARMMQVGNGNLFQCNLRDVTRLKKIEKLELLKKDVLSMAVGTSDIGGIAKHICGSLEDIYLGTFFTYFAYNKLSKSVRLESSGALSKSVRNALSKIDFSESPDEYLGRLIDKNLHSKHISNHPLWLPYQTFLSQSGYKSFISIPLKRSHGNVTGVFFGFQKSNFGLQEEDIRMVEQCVQLFGVAYEKLENERNLAANEYKYRRLVDHSPIGIAIHIQGILKYYNEEACRILKIPSRNSDIGLNISKFIHPDSAKSFEQRGIKIIEGKSVVISEEKLLNTNGDIIIVHIQGTKIHYEGEDAIQVVFSDVTKLKETERQLRMSNERFELVVKGAEAGVWDYYDIPNGKIWWSPKMYQLLGYEPYEIEITSEVFRTHVHPDDSVWALKLIRECIQQGEKYKAEYRLKTKSGKYKWFNCSGQSQLDELGIPLRMVGSVIDINEAKRAEQRLRDSEQLLNRTGMVACIGGWELILNEMKLKWTDQTYIIHELEIGSAIDVGMSLDFYHKEDQAVVVDSVEKCLTVGTPYNLAVRFNTAKGKNIWVELSGMPIYKDNKIIKLVGTLRDITDLRNQTEAIRDSERKLRNANQLALLGNWEWDVESDAVYWSEELFKIFGISKSLSPSMELFEEILHPDSKELYSDSLKNTLRNAPPQKADLKIIQRNSGRIIHISMQSINQLDVSGRVIKVIGTAQDISERKKLEIGQIRRNHYSQVLLELGMKGSTANNDWFLMNEYAKSLVNKMKLDWVWISDIDGMTAKTVRPITQVMREAHKNTPQIQKFLDVENDGLSIDVYRENQLKIVKDIKSHIGNDKWKKVMSEFGFTSYIGLPYYQDTVIKGTINMYSFKAIDFDFNFSNFLNQFAHDLGNSTYAIELKRSTNELNEFNRLLIESLDVVSVSMDLYSGKTAVSGNTESLIGYDLETFQKLIGKGYLYLHPNDITEVFKEVERSKISDGYFDIDFRVKGKNGVYTWLNSIGKIYWNGKVMRKIVGILINSELRKKEEIDQIKAQIQGRDNERIRIAKEIHDSLGQTLTVASLSLDAISKDIQVLKKDRQELFNDAYKMVNEAIDESRGISHDLMSSLLMDFGLVKSIASDVNRLVKSSVIDFIFSHNDTCQRRYSKEIETNIYNITRESLKNIIRHSNATKATVDLVEVDNELILTIQDNGIGFDFNKVKAQGGLGMSSLRSRAMSIGGELYVESVHGTVIKVVVLLRE